MHESTTFAAEAAPFFDERGADVVIALAKATFLRQSGKLVVADLSDRLEEPGDALRLSYHRDEPHSPVCMPLSSRRMPSEGSPVLSTSAIK